MHEEYNVSCCEPSLHLCLIPNSNTDCMKTKWLFLRLLVQTIKKFIMTSIMQGTLVLPHVLQDLHVSPMVSPTICTATQPRTAPCSSS